MALKRKYDHFPYPSLDRETRTAVTTDCAAHHLNREPQTLRVWACCANPPIRPMRINGRLAWPVSELRRLLTGVSMAQRE